MRMMKGRLMNEIKPLIYNMSGAAKRLGVTYPTLKRFIDDGLIKTIQYPGYSPRISERAIEDFICQGERNHPDFSNGQIKSGMSVTTITNTVRARAAAEKLRGG